MELEQKRPDKPNFKVVVMLFAATILVIALVATVIVSWVARRAKKTPFTKHPLALIAPQGLGELRASTPSSQPASSSQPA